MHADETPARAAGGTRYVHLACTAYLTLMRTGDRSADAIDAGGVLPGYTGVIVRDGYAGYGHLTDALHAWCAAHLLRDLKSLYDFEPGKQDWAVQLAALLTEARDAARGARQADQSVLEPAVLEDLVTRYRELAAAGLAANLYRRTAAANDARRIARRFLSFEDLVLRFATRPDLDIFTNNEAERTIRPVKVQQRSSGGCWRTLQGLADFAIVQSYLSTVAEAARKEGSGLTMDPDAGGPGLREWLNGIGDGHGLAAAFDTRINGVPVFAGRASRGIARVLRQHGYVLLTVPESLRIGRQNTVLDGEDSRARSWGQHARHRGEQRLRLHASLSHIPSETARMF